MKIKLKLFVVSFLIPFLAFSQQPDTLIKKLDSLNKKADSAGKQLNNINKEAYNEQTKITFSGYFILLGSDLKQEITGPFHWHKKDWGKFAKLAVIGAGLAF